MDELKRANKDQKYQTDDRRRPLAAICLLRVRDRHSRTRSAPDMPIKRPTNPCTLQQMADAPDWNLRFRVADLPLPVPFFDQLPDEPIIWRR